MEPSYAFKTFGFNEKGKKLIIFLYQLEDLIEPFFVCAYRLLFLLAYAEEGSIQAPKGSVSCYPMLLKSMILKA